MAGAADVPVMFMSTTRFSHALTRLAALGTLSRDAGEGQPTRLTATVLRPIADEPLPS